MSDSTSKIFSEFLNAFRGLADPDPGSVLAAIKPIMGDQVNHSSLVIVSEFISKLFFEEVVLTEDNSVRILGRVIPTASFTFLNELVIQTPIGVRTAIADALAILPTDKAFPASFVTEDEMREIITDSSVFNTTEVMMSRILTIAKDRLYREYLAMFSDAEPKLSTSFIPEVGHASPETGH